MKANIKNLFSLSMTDDEYFNDKQEKFELVSCPIHEKFCKELRPSINEDYLISQHFQLDKNYQKSIESLNSAYNKTLVLTDPACAGCSDFFRTTIKQSIEEVKNEHKKISVGLFNYKRYRLSSIQLETVLKEI
ncbi:MAG TPA: hypothetical protein VKA38_11530 [Draconibacterium sp.]|nr:hypothetical protein [Draconibacterium sp.]